MKKSAILISVLLIALVIGSWVSHFSNAANLEKQYNGLITESKQYLTDGLYQKAMEALEGALAINENSDARTALIEAGILAYEDGVLSSKELGKLITVACDLYPEETVYWEKLLTHYLSINSYTNAYDALLDCQRAGVSSELIKELSNTIVYSFSVSRKTYASYARNPQGYIAVYDEHGWGVIDPTGERIIDCDFTYISPYSEDAKAVFVSAKGVRLITSDGIVEYIISENLSQAKAYSDGLIPIQAQDGKWGYLDCSTGEKVLIGYDDVSSFTNGIAAVCNNGKWSLIYKDGEAVCSTLFDDVKLHSNGTYVYDGVMIASIDGAYGIFDAKGNQIADFTALDMDVYLGDKIAFKDSSNKWGFVSKNGTVAVDPTYENAKSYSNSLAAVSSGGKWGYIDNAGGVVIGYQFLDASYFSSEGSAMVSTQQGKYSVLTRRFK